MELWVKMSKFSLFDKSAKYICIPDDKKKKKKKKKKNEKETHTEQFAKLLVGELIEISVPSELNKSPFDIR